MKTRVDVWCVGWCMVLCGLVYGVWVGVWVYVGLCIRYAEVDLCIESWPGVYFRG